MSLDEEIDTAILSHVTHQWRKVARVVGAAMMTRAERVPGVNDLYYAKRVALLVEKGLIEADGDPMQIRECEIRLAKES
jgi:Protein of unknown function